MSLDSSEVLRYLVKTGIWSRKRKLSAFKHVIVDAESVVRYIYKICIRNNCKKGKNIIDLYTTTLINYIEFSNHVEIIFDFFLDNRIEPILVYEGKPMEVSQFGFIAAKFTSNRHKVSNLVSSISDYNNGGGRKRGTIDQVINELNRPNLALNLFKTIVNMRHRLGLPIKVYQAFYNSLPLMTKLAKDFECPIITDNCDSILMDVRAGFILLDDIWSKHINLKDKTSPKMMARASRISMSKSTVSTPVSSKISTYDIVCRFNYHSMFIHQHPGLNQISTAILFPLTTTDFIMEHSKSLARLNIYRDPCSFKDLNHPQSVTSKQAYRMHHNSANRLERAIFFLTTKDVEVISSMIKGEEQRAKSTFFHDYKQLYHYHLVACDFKKRLKVVLKYINDPAIFDYIEQCFTMKESTSDYLIELLCCSIGRSASFSYNSCIQFENVKSKHSANHILDESKRILMSLCSANQTHNGEVSKWLPDNQRESIPKYPTASLTIIDREYSKIVERTVPTNYSDNKLDSIRDRFQLVNIAKHTVTKQEKIALLNFIFKTQNLMKLPREIDEIVCRHLDRDEHHIKIELSIVLSLFRYCFNIAAESDKDFKSLYWIVAQHMENAIVEHYLYRNYTLTGGQTSLRSLVDLITKNDFESVRNFNNFTTSTKRVESSLKNASKLDSVKTVSPTSRRASRSPTTSNVSRSPRAASIASRTTSMSSSSKPKSPQLSASKLRRLIRHLLELLNTSLEGYYELNSLLDYPLPKLNLHIHYNPILIFNLSIYSYEQI